MTAVFAGVVEKLMVRTEACVRYVMETLGSINQILSYPIYFAFIESDVSIRRTEWLHRVALYSPICVIKCRKLCVFFFDK